MKKIEGIDLSKVIDKILSNINRSKEIKSGEEIKKLSKKILGFGVSSFAEFDFVFHGIPIEDILMGIELPGGCVVFSKSKFCISNNCTKTKFISKVKKDDYNVFSIEDFIKLKMTEGFLQNNNVILNGKIVGKFYAASLLTAKSTMNIWKRISDEINPLFKHYFEVKLKEFDLIIFDRYKRRGVLPSVYIENIRKYVENGGAVLEASGPEFAGMETLFTTPLGKILPGEPTGRVFSGPIRAKITKTGERHPITRDLPGAGLGEELPRWGKWFRHIEVKQRSGHALMSGFNGKPLLIVNRVGKGRVAQLLSDHIWLWARGYDGGGPHAELLRRISHWLMKEPEL